jgi:hypothetical protein
MSELQILNNVISELNHVKNEFCLDNLFKSGIILGSLIERLQKQRYDLENSDCEDSEEEYDDDEKTKDEEIRALKKDIVYYRQHSSEKHILLQKTEKLNINITNILLELYNNDQIYQTQRARVASILTENPKYYYSFDGKIKQKTERELNETQRNVD